MRLQGKVAIVTGGGSGIGRGICIRFAEEGADIVVADIDEEGAEQTAALVGELGRQAVTVIADVSKRDEVKRLLSDALARFGTFDILCNNAGILRWGSIIDASEEDWDRVMDVNLKGSYLGSWHAGPEMERSGGGSIINLASIIGLVGYPAGIGGGFNPYAPSKGGVVQLTRNLAVDLASKGVRVNCICPGYVTTNLTRGLTQDPETLARLEGLHPMGRLGRPEEIAQAALFLASDESSYVTGAPLVVDGGYTAQ